jgi:hypothetical protein
MLALKRDPARTREFLIQKHAGCRRLVESLSDTDVLSVLLDLGGHCYDTVVEALRRSREQSDRGIRQVCGKADSSVVGTGVAKQLQSSFLAKSLGWREERTADDDQKKIDYAFICLRGPRNGQRPGNPEQR